MSGETIFRVFIWIIIAILFFLPILTMLFDKDGGSGGNGTDNKSDNNGGNGGNGMDIKSDNSGGDGGNSTDNNMANLQAKE